MEETSFTSFVIDPNNIILNDHINNNASDNSSNRIFSQEKSYIISQTYNNLSICNNKKYSLYTYLNQIEFLDYLRINPSQTEDIYQRHIKLKSFLFDFFNEEMIKTKIDSLISLISELKMSLIEAFNLIMYYKHSLFLGSISDCFIYNAGWEGTISNIDFVLKKYIEEIEMQDDENEYKYFYSRRKVFYNNHLNIFNYLPIEFSTNNSNNCNNECSHSHSIIEMLYHPLIYKKFKCRNKICRIEKYYGIDYCPFYHWYYNKNYDNSYINNIKIGDLYKINEINSKLFKVLENMKESKDKVYKDEHELSIFNNKIDNLDVELLHILCHEFNFDISLSEIISKYQFIDKKLIEYNSQIYENNIDFYLNWKDNIKKKMVQNKLIKCIDCNVNIYNFKGKYRGKICNHFICSKCYNNKKENNFEETFMNKCNICCISQIYEYI